MFTSHCQNCGQPKPVAEYSKDYCSSCELAASTAKSYVEQENAARNEHNARILTDEVKAQIEAAGRMDFTGGKQRELLETIGLKPLLDPGKAVADARAARKAGLQQETADPRRLFNPIGAPASVQGLGMGAHIPPNVTVVKQ